MLITNSIYINIHWRLKKKDRHEAKAHNKRNIESICEPVILLLTQMQRSIGRTNNLTYIAVPGIA